ncbi:Na+/H+ antiporter subunit A [uncultured Corynebacterium sp.]|uniref:Na+/H+ antiporter subunit A n=1 Tax=uncultured Corynebacterium sp. TaxID=159447 RepID=UPI00260E1EE9|nr:Na+/H+ antiporter subunit A [uncultured Corynebacterium sp.]
MLITFLALLIATALAPVLVKVVGRAAFGILALVPAAGFAWVVTLFVNGTFGWEKPGLTATIEWMPEAHLNLEFRMDALAAIFALIILGVGALVLLYCWGYFDSAPKRLREFAGEMTCFSLAMYGLVISDNLLQMYVFWEITSVLSFMLVGYYRERASSRRAAGQALMVTTLGGLAMLVGIVLIGFDTGMWTLSELTGSGVLFDSPAGRVAVVLILAGALSKSAIAPTHFWLPGAMAAPTPVSAYLHSAAMVKAGIYLVARLSPTFHEIGSWHLVTITLGVFTMLMGGWMALRQVDLKLILAYGTVSQLGFIISVVAIGSREALMAGLALTFAHSMFKATLFMIVGAIDHTSGTRDVRKISGLGKKHPYLAILATIVAASMAGIPPLFGFVAKEAALTAVLHEELLTGMPGKIMLVGLVAGSVLTMAYSLRFLYGAFATKPASHPSGGGTSEPILTMDRMVPQLIISPTVLTLTTIVFGLFPRLLDVPIQADLEQMWGLSDEAPHLELWHGLTPALALSAFIILAGAIMHWQRGVISKLQFEQPALGSADYAYDAVIDGMRKLSLKTTASTQRGSLPLNQSVIFLTLMLVPLVALLAGERTDVRMVLWDTPLQGIIALIMIIAAIAATRLNNRLSALIMVGMTGYGLSMIFALYGAPDLALTQVLVETISMVIFMLVLRKLPVATIVPPDKKLIRPRAWLSVGLGVVVVVLSTFASNARSATPISVYIPELAKEIGHGANAVNVLLVDLRGWDTLGEISVLVIVATGVASIVFRNRDFTRVSVRPVLRDNGSQWLSSLPHTDVQRSRSIMIDVTTRLLFPSMMVLSAYFFFAGHNAPGGGFAGGLVAALAIALRYLAGGREEFEAAFPIDANRVLGTGLLLSAGTALIPMFFGRTPLSSQYWDIPVPVIGDVTVVSPLAFDAGVFLIVIGLVLHIIESLGSQLDRDEDMRKQRARDRRRRMERRKAKLRAKQHAAAQHAKYHVPGEEEN